MITHYNRMYPLFSSIYEIYKISHDSLFTRLLSDKVKMVLASLGQDERVNLQVSFTYYTVKEILVQNYIVLKGGSIFSFIHSVVEIIVQNYTI